jgi:hypothetical protein
MPAILCIKYKVTYLLATMAADEIAAYELENSRSLKRSVALTAASCNISGAIITELDSQTTQLENINALLDTTDTRIDIVADDLNKMQGCFSRLFKWRKRKKEKKHRQLTVDTPPRTDRAVVTLTILERDGTAQPYECIINDDIDHIMKLVRELRVNAEIIGVTLDNNAMLLDEIKEKAGVMPHRFADLEHKMTKIE